ncbi:sugar phosphate isomerase/epimerase family protein [Amycolatopsis deserti]|nr:sugar phosphate isomerase/epimerase [Amycolatopsis deserti]
MTTTEHTSGPPPAMIATCWTSAGNVAPMDADERSPLPIEERVRAVAAAGWDGIGIAQDDLREVRDTIGFPALRELIADAGIAQTEVELLTDWWTTDARRARSDETRQLLLDAAEELGANHIKVATTYGDPAEDLTPFVRPLRELSAQAVDRGTRIAIEGMPFSLIGSVPAAAELAHAVGHPGCGVIVDSWHVFRAGTTLAELEAALTPDILFGAELDDADATVRGSLFEDTIHHRRLCGEGVFDLVGLVETLTRAGWTGGWGVEIISREHRALPIDEALTRAISTARPIVRAGIAAARADTEENR